MNLPAPEPRSDRPDVSPPTRAIIRPHPRSFLFEEDERPESEEDDLVSHAAASEESGRENRAPGSRGRRLVVIALAAVIVLVALVAAPRIGPLLAARTAGDPGTLVVESRPAGWQVWEGDLDRGATPLTLVLPPGQRRLVLRKGTEMRELLVDVSPGVRTVYHVDVAAAPPRSSGDLHVNTKPPGAIVAVDGIGRGASPVDVRDLAAGRHVVTVLSGDRVLSETVTIEPGRSASLIVPITPGAQQVAPPAAIGWVEVRAPVPVEVYEGDSLVGSGRNPRLVLKPGRHVLRLANGELNVAATRTVQVQPGASSTLAIELPPGNLSVNAMPWAEVWVDGTRVGETPLGNFPASVGTHEIVLRHPTLGEHRRTVVVPAGVPARLGVNLR